MRTLSSERVESSFLQTKLSKITEDEVLDFYLAMTLAPSYDGFIAHYQHDRAVGRAGNLTPVPISSPISHKWHTHNSLLFCCASCQRDFISDCSRDIIPVCPECGRTFFVKEVKEDDYDG